MATCPHKLRPGLPLPMPQRIAALPISEAGWPTPFFVGEINGSREDFRFVHPATVIKAVREKLCWVCGQPLSAFKSFLIGPMCAITRTTSEPPTHLDCACYSVAACPFLNRPHMVRREDDRSEEFEVNTPGYMIKRNPGVIALWTTRTFRPFNDGQGRMLIHVGEPDSVTWWREGRPATRAEVEESIRTGLPALEEKCPDPEDMPALKIEIEAAQKFLPP